MSTKQKMELTWVSNEIPPGKWPSIRIELAEDPSREDSPMRVYEAALSVCGDPRCGCSNIHFRWLPAPSESGPAAVEPPAPFLFDLNARAIAPSRELPTTPESQRLAEIIRAGLTEVDEKRLRAWYQGRKLHIIQFTPPGQVDLANLPDASDGKMVGFVEVFPCGLALHLTLNEEAWVVHEQYCVELGCNCQETLLTFVNLKNVGGKVSVAIAESPALYYNYHTQVTHPLSTGSAADPVAEALLAEVKRVHASLNTQLHLRHLIMQDLYLRQDTERIREHLAAATALGFDAGPATSRKIGRNEPCPCGSGLKYKHCCLNKPR